ncbi:MAG: ABC-type phosphate/phosphonate transport system substrate-binding protein [Candidatus Azotimanducaceae bacterium]
MSQSIVALPMYDWPEIRQHTDQFYSLLKESLADSGFQFKNELARPDDVMSVWQNPELLLAQTCGLPYSRFLIDDVGLIGVPSYDIDCSAGQYFSVIIVNSNCKADSLNELAELDGTRLAINDIGSQSGYSAPLNALQNQSPDLFNNLITVVSGSHRFSIQAVAEGTVDFAGIDAVSWQLALRHESAAKNVRVLTRTPQTPGLPIISSFTDAKKLYLLHNAMVNAMACLNEEVRDALLLLGFNSINPKEYRPLAQRFQSLTMVTDD